MNKVYVNEMLNKANRLVDIEQRMDVIRHLMFMIRNEKNSTYGIMVEEYKPSSEELTKQENELKDEFNELMGKRKELIISMYNEVNK